MSVLISEKKSNIQTVISLPVLYETQPQPFSSRVFGVFNAALVYISDITPEANSFS